MSLLKNEHAPFFFFNFGDVLIINTSFIIRSHTVIFWVYCYSLPLLHDKKKKKCDWEEVPYVNYRPLQAVRNMSEQSQVEQLSQTYCPIHPSVPFPEPGKHPAWQIWILGILTYSMSLNWHKWCPGSTKTTLLNTVWYHLLIKSMSCPEYFAQGFIFALRTTHTATCWRSASTVVTSLMHMSLIKIRHHQKHTLVVSNQINCSCLTELSLSRAQFDTRVIKVLA